MQLKEVAGMGEKGFEQSAGFLKIPDGENPLDNTFIHPESYDACDRLLTRVRQVAGKLELSAAAREFRAGMASSGVTVGGLARELGISLPTLADMLDSLEKPGRDPRDDLPSPVLREDVLQMEDLREGMVLKGTVRNVVDFGAFVDIGLKQDGLVHISQMRDGYVASPLEVLAVGDVVTVRVLTVDRARGRIALSMRTGRNFAEPPPKK